MSVPKQQLVMNNYRYLAVLALFLPSMAEAASVIKSIVACKDEADSRKVFDFLGKNDKARLSLRQNALRAIASRFRRPWLSRSTRRTPSFSACALGAGLIATGRPMPTSIRIRPSRRHGRPRLRAVDINAGAGAEAWAAEAWAVAALLRSPWP